MSKYFNVNTFVKLQKKIPQLLYYKVNCWQGDKETRINLEKARLSKVCIAHKTSTVILRPLKIQDRVVLRVLQHIYYSVKFQKWE